MISSRLKVAIQRSGRLADHSRELLRRCGLRFTPDRDRLMWAGENLPIDVMLVRDDDIPDLVADGHCDLGIAGLNLVRETALTRAAAGTTDGLEELLTLDFGACRLSLAAPQDTPFSGLDSLAGTRIATSYPKLLEAFLRERAIDASVVTLSGSVELAPHLGKADIVCDLVSTGTTLKANELVEVHTVLDCMATLVQGCHELEADMGTLAARLVQRMRGVLLVRDSKYIMLHAPRSALPAIRSLLPGCEAPTVVPLDGCAERVAVHAVCNESVFWETLEALKGAGASAMLVLPVEKMLA